MVKRTKHRSGWNDLSPFATAPAVPRLPDLAGDEPVRFLSVAGERDDGSWGLVGAFWLSSSGRNGGFFVSPTAIWHGSEMARSYRGALDRGWTEERIFSYWESQSGATGSYMIDPVEEATSVFDVARRVGAL